MIDCTVIIVNYKSAGMILDCLESVYTQIHSLTFEVIIVDNNSQDDSRSVITARFPDLTWIQMDYNSGFARANNAGIRQARGNVILLLNPDTLIREGAIEKACHDLVQSEYIACGVQLLNEDGSPQISGNYAMTGGLNYLLPLPYLGNWLSRLARIFRMKKPNVPQAEGVVEVDWINGAFLLVKKDVIDRAGLMDEDFFLFAEEAEWCSRLKKEGKLCLFGQYHVVHRQGESVNFAFNTSGKGYYNLYDKKGLQIMLSNFLRIRREFGLWWFLFQLFIYTLMGPLFWLFSFLHDLLRGKLPFTQLQRLKGLQ